jgi:predicted ATPase/DNA-binding CsgD family transcriptional regulator
MLDRVEQQFGSYRLVQLLGRGNFADVYLGEHVHLGTQAAIKVLHGPLESRDREGFLAEARTVARLRHPHIVRILDFGVQDGTPFLVMEDAPAGTLRQRHPKGTRLPLLTVVTYVKQVAEALQYAHAQRLIHRDLKPENLLLGPEQQVWLSDFGLALVAHSARSQPFQPTAGTLAYMAPEQLQGHPTAASDQYALGVLVYEWLTGERPFSGAIPELAVKQALASPPALSEKVPTLPVMVDQVVLQALTKDPQLRFASSQAFALALEEASRAESSSGQTVLMPSSQYSAASAQAAKHNLPAQLTPLIGREQEVAAVCTLLRCREVRLVTLTGTGGVGKTRLALQVATEVLADFPHGVSFVSLAPISNPNLVMPTIAQVLDIKENGTRPLQDLLTTFLRDKHLLLCLDNFEQLLPAAPQLTDLLIKCPHLTILVTSRAVLHVQGEREFPVPPLATPDLTQLPATVETLPHYGAVALFLERAQAVQPTFQLTSTNARSIAEICVHLDGLPLAIELAVARLKLLSPQALLARLDQRLAVLTSGTQDAPARQQTLRNTIAWSYHLLDAQEQRLFRRLSVFMSGCTLQAIEAMDDPPSDGNGVGQTLDGVASLIDKSLLQQTKQEDGELRFLMLETIREYATERLVDHREEAIMRRRHADYYLALTEQAEPLLSSEQRVLWLNRLEQEHQNLRAALVWLFQEAGRADLHLKAALRERALRLVGALWWFWYNHCHYREGRHWLQAALALMAQASSSQETQGADGGDAPHHALDQEQVQALSPHLRAKILTGAGVFEQIYNPAVALSLHEESLQASRSVGDILAMAATVNDLAWVALRQANYEQAERLGQQSLALGRTLADARSIAAPLLLLGMAALFQHKYEQARFFFEESLQLWRDVGDTGSYARLLPNLAYLAVFQGQYSHVMPLIAESMRLSQEEGNPFGVLMNLIVLIELAVAQKQLHRAVRLLAAGQRLCEALGYRWSAAFIQDRIKWLQTNTRRQLGEATFRELWAEGWDMERVQLLNYALEADSQTGEQVRIEQEQDITHEPLISVPQSAASVQAPSLSPDGLTAREMEVLGLLARGLTNAQIAEELVVSLLTVKVHLRSIYSKLGVTSRVAATRYALEHDLS